MASVQSWQQVQSVCVAEIEPVLNKINAFDDSSIHCITEHPGFSSVCLNTWVLQTVFTGLSIVSSHAENIGTQLIAS